MDEKLRYATFECALGWVGILASVSGLRRLTLPQPSSHEARKQLGTEANQATWEPHGLDGLIKRLKAYYEGSLVDFPDELDLAGATQFQRRVWEITRLIPCGETRSYRWVAEEIGQPGAQRAVGQALGRNPLPVIIPCHRVLASDGRLGGFTGGLEMKRRLLRLECPKSEFQNPKS